MAKSKNPTPDPLLAAPFAAVPPATPKQNEVALKGTTTTRFYGAPKSEKTDVAADAPNAPKITIDAEAKTAEIAFERRKQMELIENGQELTTAPFSEWLKENLGLLGPQFDAKDKVDNAYAQFQYANPTDRQTTARFEAREFAPFLFNPRNASHHGRNVNSPNAIIDDGFKAPASKLDKNETRTKLAADIKTVSDMYAGEAGMSSKDFAKVMGGIATIESRFGVLRSVSGTKYASSAGGAFHYLDGTIAGEVRQKMSDPRIANRVEQLGVTLGNGVAKSEAYIMKEDNVLAGSVLAKKIVETVRQNPQLKDDIAALTTRVYQSHNLGDAGARALARGGRAALEALDHKADDNNPAFFRGASSDAEINGRYKKFVTAAIRDSSDIVESPFTAPTVVAENRPQQQPVKVAALALPERAPS